MRLKCNRAELDAALAHLVSIIPSRSAKPVLQCLHLRGLEDGTIALEGNDLEVGMRILLRPESISEPCAVLLPAGKFANIIRGVWDETVEIHCEGNQAVIKTSSNDFRLMGSADTAEYPPLPEMEATGSIEIAAADFCQAADKTIFAAAKGERYAMNGVLFSVDGPQIDFVASDTHRLSLVRKKLRGEGFKARESIVMTKGMSALAKLAAGEELLTLELRSNCLIGQTRNAMLVTRLVEGQFPRYRDVIPKEMPLSVTVDRELLRRIVQLAGDLSNDETHSITLQADAAAGRISVAVTGGNVGEGHSEMPAEIEGGKNLQIVFNYIYLLDLLRVVQEPKVRIQARDGNHPVRFDAGDFTHIIMPIRAQG